MYFQVQINKQKNGISEFIFSTLSEVIAFYAGYKKFNIQCKNNYTGCKSDPDQFFLAGQG